MKVLLIGEFSGFFTTLKAGLLELGVDVKHAAAGKNWGGGAYDIPLMPEFRSKIIHQAYRQAFPLMNSEKLKGYDIVQFVNPAMLGVLNPFNSIVGKRVIESSGRSYMSAAGDDSYYFSARNNLRYNPLDEAKKIDFRGRRLSVEYAWARRWTEELAKRVNGVIPVAYDYAQAYRNKPEINLRKTIPLPVDLKKNVYIGCCRGSEKIKVYHGINRIGYKGTGYIKEAFKILNEKYSARAEFVIKDNMGFDEYLEYMRGVDIVVDQVNSYSSGMNGIIGLAMGKIVLGGAEPESLNEFELAESPILNITPSVEDIVAKLSTLIELDREKLRAIGDNSRRLAESLHCHIKIATKYLEVWRA